MNRIQSLSAVLLAILLGGAQALADDAKDCGRNDLAPDTRIAACTRLIAAAKAPGANVAPADLARAHRRRAGAYEIKLDYDRAIADLDETIRLEPASAPSYVTRCNVWNLKRDPARALRDCDEAIRLDPKNVYAHNNRGDANSKLGRLDDALRDFDEAIRLGLKHSVVFDNRGEMHRRKGDYDRAIADFTEAIRIDPKDALPWHNRSQTNRLRSEFALALADSNEAIRLDPTFTGAYSGRGLIHERMANRDLAIADYRKALSLPLEPLLGSWSHATARDRLTILGVAPQPTAAPKVDPGRRVALVVGNSAYKAVPALPNPKRDADAIAAALRRVGFQTVSLHNDLGRENLVAALRNFALEADKADWALVYFAGHGLEINGTNFLIPVDAKIQSDRDVQLEAIPLESVTNALNGAKKLRVIMLDACRDNPFASQMQRTGATRSVGRGLASIEPTAGTLVVYAAKHGEVALDGDGKNSPFAQAFIKNLEVPGLEVRRLFDYVRDDVMDTTGRRQQPFSYGSVPGRQDFFFVANK